MPHAAAQVASQMSSPVNEDTPTYFALFDLPPRLTIDTAELERAFYRLSRKLHPDLYARKSAEEQAWSLRQSSLLNDAYRTLKNPIARTEYLLELEGLRRKDENKQDGASAKQSRVPADLLEEVFEFNMQLEEMRMNLKMGQDDPDLRTDLTAAQQQFTGMLDDTDSDLRAAWGTWDSALDAGDAAGKDAAKGTMAALLDRRSYLRNLVRDVAAVLEPATGDPAAGGSVTNDANNGEAVQTGA
jgi:molecular chaperone HscB